MDKVVPDLDYLNVNNLGFTTTLLNWLLRDFDGIENDGTQSPSGSCWEVLAIKNTRMTTAELLVSTASQFHTLYVRTLVHHARCHITLPSA